jgi:hypothetical protein
MYRAYEQRVGQMTPDEKAKLLEETVWKLSYCCVTAYGECEFYRDDARTVLEAFADKLTAATPDRSAFACMDEAPGGWSCELPQGHKGSHAALIGRLSEIRW